MKRLSTIIMALVLALGLTQCKKDQPTPNVTEGETYTISLSVKGNSNAKVDVNTQNGHVDYATGDQILVASNGTYAGTLVYDGTVFTGSIGNVTEGMPLQFYFLGNVTPEEELSIGNTESCSVVISDQTDHLPVISGAPSNENFYSNVTNYTAELLNKCALVKFNVTTSSEAPTCLKGFNNKVTIDFGVNTFTNSQEDNGIITLPAGNGEKWAILLPQEAKTGGEAYAAGDEYAGTFGAVPALFANGMFPAGIAVDVTTSTHNYLVDLSTLTGDYEAVDGDTLTGTLSQHYNISVAEGASVTLWNASINPSHSYKSPHNPCIRCDNDATIVIEGENDMYVWTEQMPCIYIASGKTLTITGNGSLNASSTGMITAAIGGCYSSGNSCGNIVIESGNITATAGSCAAIGAGFNGNCGNITINGGTITATSTGATAIGCGNQMCFTCGDITINGGTVTATGSRAGIGGGYQSNCGDITITGGTIIATGTSGSGIGAGNSTSGTWGYCGNITISGGNVTASSSGGVGIGGGCLANCGDILISGGTVTATGGNDYVAIGGSTNHTCGSITITEGATSVTATKGANAPRCIGMGKGDYAICGTVTFGGTEYPSGATPNQADGLTFVYPVQETTITWNSSFINSVSIMPWGHDSGVSASDGGITATFTENAGLSSSGITIGNSSAYGITFSTTTGNISKIEIYGTDNSANGLPSGWSYDGTKVTWQGTSASSVTMNGVNAGPGEDVHIDYISQIVFTVQQ